MIHDRVYVPASSPSVLSILASAHGTGNKGTVQSDRRYLLPEEQQEDWGQAPMND
jgi:hypothetical protein